MGETEKKKGLPPDSEARQGVLILVCALLIPPLFCIGTAALIGSPHPFQFSSDLSLWYTLRLLALDPSVMEFAILIVSILFVGFMAALPRKQIWAGFVGKILLTLIGLAVIIFASFFPFFSPVLTPLQTLSHDDHVYRLLYAERLDYWEFDEAYVVIECDSLNLACRYYAAPMFVDGWIADQLREEGLSDKKQARLFVEDEGQELKLRAGELVYPMQRRGSLYDN